MTILARHIDLSELSFHKFANIMKKNVFCQFAQLIHQHTSSTPTKRALNLKNANHTLFYIVSINNFD